MRRRPLAPSRSSRTLYGPESFPPRRRALAPFNGQKPDQGPRQALPAEVWANAPKLRREQSPSHRPRGVRPWRCQAPVPCTGKAWRCPQQHRASATNLLAVQPALNMPPPVPFRKKRVRVNWQTKCQRSTLMPRVALSAPGSQSPATPRRIMVDTTLSLAGPRGRQCSGGPKPRIGIRTSPAPGQRRRSAPVPQPLGRASPPCADDRQQPVR